MINFDIAQIKSIKDIYSSGAIDVLITIQKTNDGFIELLICEEIGQLMKSNKYILFGRDENKNIIIKENTVRDITNINTDKILEIIQTNFNHLFVKIINEKLKCNIIT